MAATVIKHEYPSRVLISGGREIGGVGSFAEGLRAGFDELGIPAEIVSPNRIYLRTRELRDARILKILSTTAVFSAPLGRRCVCMAHGFPCVAYKGWLMVLAVLASYRLANVCRGSQLVAVSEYSALILREIYGLRVDAVIKNPLRPVFLEPGPQNEYKRRAITYAGRLHPTKNVCRLLQAAQNVLDEDPGLHLWIIGDGPTRPELERLAANDERIEFFGTLTPTQMLDKLRRTSVFISGNPTEPLGITYIEALSQGCAVAMPASGGGLEVAPEVIGGKIQLFSATVTPESVAAAIRKALLARPQTVQLSAYSPRAVAEAYLAVDARFFTSEKFRAGGIR